MYSKINVKQSFSDFILYIFPSVVTMVLVSFYSAIDSWFLAQYVSTNAMAAISIVLPYSNLIWGLAVMFTCGSCALVGIKLGEGKRHLANTYFTSMFWFLTGFTVIFAIAAYLNMDRIIYSLGSTALLFEDCKTYLKYMILGTPILAVKLFLEYYIRLDGRPAYSLAMSLTGFILNIALDYYTIVVLGWGVFGASLSTITSIAVSTLMGLAYFRIYETNLRFTKFHWNKWYFIKSSFNGAGEMLTELSSGIVTIFFNIAIIKFAGEDGVAAMAVNINIFYFLISIYLGIATGAQPVISYAYGAQNKKRLSEIIDHCKKAILFGSLAVFTLARFYGSSIIAWYIGDNQQVIDLAVHGFRMFSYCFIFLGFNIFIAGFYTAIGNGLIAGIISLLRSLVFVLAALFTLPSLIGINGIWLSIPFAELATMIISIVFYLMFINSYFKKLAE